MNNRRRWLFAQQARWFTSLFDADAIAQRARIVADGGTNVAFHELTAFIKGLKSESVYSNAKGLFDARFGVKKDENNAVSKWYDVSANNRDSVQVTGSYQPVWGANSGIGSLPGITFDGTNDRLTFSGYTSKPATYIMKFQRLNPEGKTGFIVAGDSGCLSVQVGGALKPELDKSYQKSIGKSTISTGFDHVVVAVTYSSTGKWAFFVNGDVAGSGTNNQSITVPITSIGNKGTSDFFKGVMSSLLLFDTPLTQAKIQTISAL